MHPQRFEHGEHFFWFAKQNRVQCPEIGYLSRKIAQRYTDSTGNNAKYIEHIIANVYLGWAYNQAVAYFSKNEYWTQYNSTIKDRKDKFSIVTFRKELNFLMDNDLVQVIKGHKVDGNSHLSMASRMLSTEKLEAEFDIAWEVYAELADENIRYKLSKDSVSIPASEFANHPEIEPVTEEVEQRKEDLTAYNNYIRQQFCDYEDFVNTYLWDSENKVAVKQVNRGYQRFIPLLSAVYSGGWKRGGRLYARSVYGMVDYQHLSKSQRSTIRINGEKTVEVDYSCLHLSMMYAKCGLQLDKDAYAWCGDRALAKKLTIICLNNGSRASAVASCKKFLSENGYDTMQNNVQSMINAMIQYHFPIRYAFFSKAHTAVSMQHDDSNIMMGVLNACRKRNIPALPVHDSVIVPMSRKESAIRIMKEQYKAYTGFEIEVK